MAEPQKITGDNLPDLMLDHRLTAAITPEAGNAISDGAAPEIGGKMEDGTIYAGLSPDTGEAMYVTLKDAPSTLKWKAAMKYAADLNANGHKDWKVPTKAELNVLFENRAKIGGLNESGSFRANWYWSSTEFCSRADVAWVQWLRDGFQYWHFKDGDASVRPVRSGSLP